MPKNNNIPVLFVDSECAFCNRSVHFIEQRLGNNKIIFRSLYGEEAKAHLVKHGLNDDYDDSIVYLANNKAYTKSGAALRVAKQMKGLYPLLSIFLIVPRIVRDRVYDLIAKHRHKLI